MATQCLQPYHAYRTGKRTAKGNMAYFMDLDHQSENDMLFIGANLSKRIDYLQEEPYAKKIGFNWYLTDYILAPCGKCPACQLNKASEWASRLYFESKTCAQWYFVTLTYSDMYYNQHSLDKKDFLSDISKFLKRLRKSIYPVKLRYFYSMEYGDHTKRGHFHLCLFFDKVLDDKLVFLKKKYDYDYFSSKLIEKCWPFGFNVTVLCNDTLSCFNYVSRYCCKKVGSDDGFCNASRNPGLGYSYLEQIAPDLKDSQIMIHTQGKTFFKKYPSFFRDKLRILNPTFSEFLDEKIKSFINIQYMKDKNEDRFNSIPNENCRVNARMVQFFADEANKFKKII